MSCITAEVIVTKYPSGNGTAVLSTSILSQCPGSAPSTGNFTCIGKCGPGETGSRKPVPTTTPSAAPLPPTEPSYTLPVPSAPSCVNVGPDEPMTFYMFVPNNRTLTLGPDTLYVPVPEFTPPIPCPTLTVIQTSAGGASPYSPMHTSATRTTTTTTVIITSKNPVVVYTPGSAPPFPGPSKPYQKTTHEPPSVGAPTMFPTSAGQAEPIHKTTPPITTIAQGSPGNGNGGDGGDGGRNPNPHSINVSGVDVVLTSGRVVINGQTVASQEQGSWTTMWADGQIFTINPSQVIAPGTVVAIAPSGGGVFAASSEPTAIVVVGGQTVSAIGASVAVIGGDTFTYGPASAPQTDFFNGETITIGPSGIELADTTLGGPSNPSSTLLGVAGGLTVTEIGATLAIISGTTFTVGPGAPTTTAMIAGKTIEAGPPGLDLGFTTLSYPLQAATQTITAEGVTFSEIGSSLAVIGGSTYTIGSGAPTITAVYHSFTLSIGPGGVGFPTTTVGGPPPTGPASHKGQKNDVNKLRPLGGAALLCILTGVGIFL